MNHAVLWGSGRIWKHRLNYALHIPEELRALRLVLDIEGRSAFIAQIQRLAQLDSANAAALLAYLNLRGEISGQPDLVRALQLCRDAGRHHNAYVQYVEAWVHWELKDYRSAMDRLRQSGAQLFPPAALDLSRYVWHGWGIAEPDKRIAMQLLRHADALGHAASLLVRSTFYRSGQLGVARRILGYFLYPVALMRYGLELRFNPFSARVFLVDLRVKRSVFKRNSEPNPSGC